MGIYDRDYYRREGPSYLESLIPSGAVCKWLIGINIVVFIFQVMGYVAPHLGPTGLPVGGQRGWVTEFFILDTPEVLSGQVWRLLSYAFLHSPDSWMHIFFNMLFLWWFGSDLEALYRPREFLAFYLASATFGGIAYVAWQLAAGNDRTPCLGASGAVTALLILYAFHFPNRMITIFFFLPVPIWLFALFNVAQDTFGLVGGQRNGVAVVVHLAGALFAAVYYKFQLRLIDLFDVSDWFGWLKKRRINRPRLKVYRPDDEVKEPVGVSAPAAAAAGVDEHFEARLDAVLEKLARTGKESLTDSEREILLRASEIYKRRRS